MKYTKLVLFIFILINSIGCICYSQVSDSSSAQSRIELNNQVSEIKIPLNINAELLAKNNSVEKFRTESSQQLNSSLPGINADTEKSSLTTDLLYVAGTAALAAIVYFLWPEKDTQQTQSVTFGKPVHP